MKLLIEMKAGDLNFKNHVYPLTCIDCIDKIFVVRDNVGPSLNKVKYICPPHWSLKFPPLNFLFKFFIMLIISIKHKPAVVLGFLFFPHGLMALFVGLITRRKTGVSLIAGPVEVYSFLTSKKEKYVYSKDLPPLKLEGKFILNIIKKFDCIIVGGEYSKSFLESLGVNKEKIFILYKNVDANFKNTGDHKKYDLVYVGRLSDGKNVETVIKAVSLIKNNGLKLKVRIVGDGPIRGKLENLSQNLGLDQEVRFVGWKNDPWNWFNASKISILPSDREGFPQSVVQSLNCGVPVICSMCGDVVDILRSGFNGILIKNNEDIHSFAEAIEYLLSNQQTLDQFSFNALNSSYEYFSLDAVTQKWRCLLSKLNNNENFNKNKTNG